MAKKFQTIPFAEVLVKKVKIGTKFRCDGGFTCLKNGAVRTVKKDKKGNFYILCKEGHHDLSGQLNRRGDKYIGFWLI